VKKYKIPILMYHSIEKMPRSTIMRSLHVPPKRFKFQMWILYKLGYKGLSLKELKPYLDGKKIGKVVGITFDDGYKNNLLNAAPILSKFNFSATCYIVGDRIGETNSWDLSHGITQRPLMTLNEIKKWLELGMDIGAHTNTHANLTKLTKPQLVQEIYQCKKKLENFFDVTITDFCYPFGQFHEDSVKVVSESGYLTATTMNRGRVNFDSDQLTLPRIPITHHTLPHLFMLKLLSKYEDKR